MTVDAYDVGVLVERLPNEGLQITCCDVYGEHMYIGTGDGLILKFLYTTVASSVANSDRTMARDKTSTQQCVLIASTMISKAGRAINFLKVINGLRMMIVRIGERVAVVRLPSLKIDRMTETYQDVLQGVGSMCYADLSISGYHFSSDQVGLELLVAKKKELLNLNVSRKCVRVAERHKITSKPRAMTRRGNVVCIALHDSYVLLDVRTGVSKGLFSFDASFTHPVIKVVCDSDGGDLIRDTSEFLVVMSTEDVSLGVFVSTTGESMRQPLLFATPPTAIAIDYPFVISALSTPRDELCTLSIHNLLTGDLEQSVVLPAPPTSLYVNAGVVVCVGNTRMDVLHRIPMHARALAFIQGGRVEEGVSLARDTVSARKFNMILRHAAYQLLASQRYDLAMDYCYESGGDPAEVIQLYPDLSNLTGQEDSPAPAAGDRKGANRTARGQIIDQARSQLSSASPEDLTHALVALTKYLERVRADLIAEVPNCPADHIARREGLVDKGTGLGEGEGGEGVLAEADENTGTKRVEDGMSRVSDAGKAERERFVGNGELADTQTHTLRQQGQSEQAGDGENTTTGETTPENQTAEEVDTTHPAEGVDTTHPTSATPRTTEGTERLSGETHGRAKTLAKGDRRDQRLRAVDIALLQLYVRLDTHRLLCFVGGCGDAHECQCTYSATVVSDGFNRQRCSVPSSVAERILILGGRYSALATYYQATGQAIKALNTWIRLEKGETHDDMYQGLQHMAAFLSVLDNPTIAHKYTFQLAQYDPLLAANVYIAQGIRYARGETAHFSPEDVLAQVYTTPEKSSQAPADSTDTNDLSEPLIPKITKKPANLIAPYKGENEGEPTDARSSTQSQSPLQPPPLQQPQPQPQTTTAGHTPTPAPSTDASAPLVRHSPSFGQVRTQTLSQGQTMPLAVTVLVLEDLVLRRQVLFPPKAQAVGVVLARLYVGAVRDMVRGWGGGADRLTQSKLPRNGGQLTRTGSVVAQVMPGPKPEISGTEDGQLTSNVYVSGAALACARLLAASDEANAERLCMRRGSGQLTRSHGPVHGGGDKVGGDNERRSIGGKSGGSDKGSSPNDPAGDARAEDCALTPERKSTHTHTNTKTHADTRHTPTSTCTPHKQHTNTITHTPPTHTPTSVASSDTDAGCTSTPECVQSGDVPMQTSAHAYEHGLLQYTYRLNCLLSCTRLSDTEASKLLTIVSAIHRGMRERGLDQAEDTAPAGYLWGTLRHAYAMLCVLANEHEKALALFHSQLGDLQVAVGLCGSVCGQTGTSSTIHRMFLTLLTMYMSPAEDVKDLYKENAINLLNRHSDKFDSAIVTAILPPDWTIASVLPFLQSSLMRSQSRARTSEVQRGMLHIRLDTLSNDLATGKRSTGVVIGPEATCVVCDNDFHVNYIQDEIVWLPSNGKCAHRECIPASVRGYGDV